jgi:hypothetical protein
MIETAGHSELDPDALSDDKRVDLLANWVFAGMHLGALMVLFAGVSWLAVAVGLFTLWVRLFGITGGYHRFFSHRSYKTSRAFQLALAWLGASAGQNGPLWWASHHRLPHRHADDDDDARSTGLGPPESALRMRATLRFQSMISTVRPVAGAIAIAAVLLAGPAVAGGSVARVTSGGATASHLSQSAPTVLTVAQLQADFAIFKRAHLELHPGLYRYSDSLEMEGHFDSLERRLHVEMTLSEAYLEFSRLLAKIRCGHTYANFWNQSDRVKEEVLGGADKVPFTFRLIDRRMVVTQATSERAPLPRGTEILSINGVRVPEVLDSLLTVVAADGSNDVKRIDQLQVSGIGDYEYFDIYFPLFFPPHEGTFELRVRTPGSVSVGSRTVRALTRAQRRERLAERSSAAPENPDDLWRYEVLDPQSAHLRIGTFVTWKMELDWRTFLREAFTDLEERGIRNLILDVRGNEGGDNAVLNVLRGYLTSKPIRIEPVRELLRYREVPSELEPYLDTWDESFKRRGDRVVETPDGYYTWANRNAEARTIEPRSDAFDGHVLLLVGAANSSATFTLASILQRHGLATLVGQETGGSQRGINGGQFFFLRLPNSGIESDIPLIGYYLPSEEPDAGITPDVYVQPTIEDVVNDVDAELEAARRLIGS